MSEEKVKGERMLEPSASDSSLERKFSGSAPAEMRLLEPAALRRAALLGAFSFILALLVHVFVIQHFPNSADEYAYLWQAENFARGHVTALTPEPAKSFEFIHLGDNDGVRYCRFPPGWPMLLTLGVWSGFTGWVNPLLAALALAGIFLLGRKWVGERASLYGVLLTGLSPFFLLNAASFHSHPSCLFAFSMLALGICRSLESRKQLVEVDRSVESRGQPAEAGRSVESARTATGAGRRVSPTKVGAALFSGAMFGLAVMIRPFSGLLVGLPLVAYAGLELRKRSQKNGFWPWFFLGGAPFALSFAGINHAITGDWLLLATRLYDPAEGLGFGGVHGHSLRQGLQTTLLWWVEGLAFTFFLSPLLLFAARGQLKDRPQKKLLWLLLFAPMIGYLFYWNTGGERYGPRFYFEALLAFSMLTGVGLVRVIDSGRYRALLVGAGVMGLAILGKLSLDTRAQIHSRQDLFRKVEEAGLSQAVVLLLSGSSDMISLDLTRNPPAWQRVPVLYGRGQGEGDREVARSYPERRLFYYRWSSKGGKLWPVDLEHPEPAEVLEDR